MYRAPQSLIVQSFLHVVVGGALIALSVLKGHFDSVNIEIGLSQYAETLYWGRNELVPAWLPMPANTVVNLGYILIGFYWLLKIRSIHLKSNSYLDDSDAYMFYSFCWMSILYGPVQCGRILTQHRILAILDQWYTLPIFVWIAAWSLHVLRGWNSFHLISIVSISISTYFLTTITNAGFDIALTIHIILVAFCAVAVYKRHPERKTLTVFYKGLVCCAGFVFLKLLDATLAEFSSFFGYLSGHFWSKIADFLQIHYACLFFLSIIETREKTD